jgi:hypothetical protein
MSGGFYTRMYISSVYGVGFARTKLSWGNLLQQGKNAVFRDMAPLGSSNKKFRKSIKHHLGRKDGDDMSLRNVGSLY